MIQYLSYIYGENLQFNDRTFHPPTSTDIVRYVGRSP